jgi:hypothetical protein
MRYLRAVFNFEMERTVDAQGRPLIADNPAKVLATAMEIAALMRGRLRRFREYRESPRRFCHRGAPRSIRTDTPVGADSDSTPEHIKPRRAVECQSSVVTTSSAAADGRAPDSVYGHSSLSLPARIR